MCPIETIPNAFQPIIIWVTISIDKVTNSREEVQYSVWEDIERFNKIQLKLRIINKLINWVFVV